MSNQPMKSTDEPSLLYTKVDGIARITFNRPAVHNAVDPEALCRLADAWRDVATDDATQWSCSPGPATERSRPAPISGR